MFGISEELQKYGYMRHKAPFKEPDLKCLVFLNNIVNNVKCKEIKINKIKYNLLKHLDT
jgi:hypothetical protein